MSDGGFEAASRRPTLQGAQRMVSHPPCAFHSLSPAFALDRDVVLLARSRILGGGSTVRQKCVQVSAISDNLVYLSMCYAIIKNKSFP
jgi:hypothetical protein